MDRETAKIDNLIAKKERLIELLEEKRSALITHAVTRGLNPNAPLRDSGIEWLGQIPAHWEVLQLKRTFRGCNYGTSESSSGVGSIRVLGMGNVQEGEIVLPEFGVTDEIDDNLLLNTNDLLFNRTNSRELVGKVGIFRGVREDRVAFASYLVRLRCNPRAEPEYLNFLLNSKGVLSFVQSLALLSVNQANLNPSRYGKAKIPLPPVNEQRSIATHLRNICEHLGGLIAEIHRGTERLKEYRAALVTEAVIAYIVSRERMEAIFETLEVLSNPQAVQALRDHKSGRTRFMPLSTL